MHKSPIGKYNQLVTFVAIRNSFIKFEEITVTLTLSILIIQVFGWQIFCAC